MLFWRFLVSSLFMCILLLPQLKKMQLNVVEAIKIIFYGAAFYGTCSILYFVATEYIGSGLAMVIFFTYPTMVLLINFAFFKQKISKIYYLALIVILVGMLFLVNGSKLHFDLMGVGLSLVSALLYAFYIIVSKNNTTPALVSTLFISMGAMLVSLAAALLEKTFLLPLGTNVWFNICGIGIICTALPIVFLLEGLKHISSLQASILSVLEPVFVVIFGILLLGEKINLIQALGVIILLAGALMSLLSHRFE